MLCRLSTKQSTKLSQVFIIIILSVGNKYCRPPDRGFTNRTVKWKGSKPSVLKKNVGRAGETAQLWKTRLTTPKPKRMENCPNAQGYTHMKPIIINNSLQPQVLSCSLLQISVKTFCFQCRKLSMAQCLLKTLPPSLKAKQSIRRSPVQFLQNISSFAPYIYLFALLEYKNGPTSWRRQSLQLQTINHLGNLILNRYLPSHNHVSF